MAVSYNKLYSVLEEKDVTMVELRKAADIAPNTMTRIRKNEEVSLDVLGRICKILHADFGDIMEYVEEKED
ncbi:MAG: helix-turn-helix transcriptional regulator [Lachnospiraceae bacterium]|nr:helix-turn-helix transcriptional regulator [Lachnospiraceae bacterium]